MAIWGEFIFQFLRFEKFDYNSDNERIIGNLIAKVTMFAVEMWFGAEYGVECGRSTGLCPLPLGVPRCVIHNKKNVGT
ncbi:MAG: hypothetical protein PUE80_07075, partial [bacterium]|nr:hypothetical protein [bacterium]